MRVPSNDPVLNLVRRAIVQDSDIQTNDIYEHACRRFPELKDMDRRRFHGRYVLRAKRELSKGRKVRSNSRRRQYKASPEAALPEVALPLNEDSSQQGTRRASQRPTATERVGGSRSNLDREAVRAAFFAFASDLVTAADHQAVVEAVRGLDRYIEQALD